jgi:hypothetical protein
MMIFECQVLACGVALLLHGCMVTWSVLLLDEFNVDDLFNARIDYMSFVSFLFAIGSYKNIDPCIMYIYSISQYVINGLILYASA